MVEVGEFLPDSSAAAVANDAHLVISHTTTVGKYNLTVWSDAPGTSSILSRAVAPRCGSNQVTCSSSNRADSTICNNLINELNNNAILGNSPRAVCLGQSNDECCVSWHTAVGDLPERDLYNAARDTYNQCATGTVSGAASDVNLNGHCVRQCLSNRATSC
ncbi:hypothetical protein C8R45DRAFT_839927 [Mycena sanguinolenta]|nr:hypothetical protein C8R45DRAFT_839927 [Mycena sanguinolenta]